MCDYLSNCVTVQCLEDLNLKRKQRTITDVDTLKIYRMTSGKSIVKTQETVPPKN